MSKKIGILCTLCVMLTMNLFSQDQVKKNIIGFGAGICPARKVYVGGLGWVDINVSPVIQVFCTRQVLQAVRLGSYFEYENAKFKDTNDKAARYNMGFSWLAQYPDKPFHAQLGGYFGYGFVKTNNWDQSLGGIDYGIIIGPAYEKNSLGIALHVQSGYCYYTSSGAPDEVSYSKGRFLLKVYYKF